jgi:hypothetical protein
MSVNVCWQAVVLDGRGVPPGPPRCKTADNCLLVLCIVCVLQVVVMEGVPYHQGAGGVSFLTYLLL